MSLEHVLVRGLTKRYGDRVVLRDVSLSIKRGRVTAVLGPNAAGKSTLMKSVLALVRHDSAQAIYVDGAPVRDDERYRERIGYMPQGVRFPDQLRGDELLTLLKGIRGLTTQIDEELIDAFALREVLKQPIRAMSGGTRQKLNAATAFLFRPSLVLLDEPTAGLDPVASRVLLEKVRRARNAGTTIVLTSHILAEVQELADDIAYLADGVLRFSGSLPDLFELTQERSVDRALDVLLSRAA
jgi:Cu-processing system ATP-binding protein